MLDVKNERLNLNSIHLNIKVMPVQGYFYSNNVVNILHNFSTIHNNIMHHSIILHMH